MRKIQYFIQENDIIIESKDIASQRSKLSCQQ